MPPKKKHIRQHDHEIGYWTGGKRDVGRFEALTNFGVKLLKHVVAPQELPSETCFVVRVTQMGTSQSLEKGLVIYILIIADLFQERMTFVQHWISTLV